MICELTQTLSRWLEKCTPLAIGQILIRERPGGYELIHEEDAGREDLLAFVLPEDARALSTLDDKGAYRPLKSAPNLRHGWRLLLEDLKGLRKALDFFYPAATGILRDWQEGRVATVNLRDTLARQSGMYAVTRRLTDEQAQGMIGNFCTSAGGCLKTILWRISPEVPILSLPDEEKTAPPCSNGTSMERLPLLCPEACNLLIAKAREVVKEAKTVE